MLEIILPFIGYAASIIIALSMTISSIVKFRWVNLIGAFTFSIYGFIIGAYPVGFLNGFIVLVDLYYLSRIYSKQDLFETLEIRPDNKYLLRFLEFHKTEIEKFFPKFQLPTRDEYGEFFCIEKYGGSRCFLGTSRE